MIRSIIILIHFFNITLGFTCLVFFSKRFFPNLQSAQKLFVQQVLFYNIALILTATSDFLYFYFWKEVSKNEIALGFLSLINIATMASAIIWCVTFVLMVYKFLEIPTDIKSIPAVKYGSIFVILLLIYCFIDSIFHITPSFYGNLVKVLNFTIILTSLGYSSFLYIKSNPIENVNRKKALRIFSILLIIFSLCSIIVYVDAFTLHIFSTVVSKFSFNALDLIFNSFVFFWAFRYFNFLNTTPSPVILDKVTEE